MKKTLSLAQTRSVAGGVAIAFDAGGDIYDAPSSSGGSGASAGADNPICLASDYPQAAYDPTDGRMVASLLRGTMRWITTTLGIPRTQTPFLDVVVGGIRG